MSDIVIPEEFYAAVFVYLVLAIFLLAVAFLAATSFIDSPRGQKMIRDHLGRRLARSRMWSMLKHRHIAPLTYVERNSIAELRHQLKVCASCKKQDLCDETLGYVGWRHRHYGFCPNRRAMDRFAAPPGMARRH